MSELAGERGAHMNDVVFGALMFVIGVAAAATVIASTKFSAIERQLNRLSRLEGKVDALLEHAGVTFDEFRGVPGDVREALARGETILAIKRLRQATGVGLKEAKERVDELRRRQAP